MINKDDFYSKLAKIPKGELHLHSEAVVSRVTVLELMKRSNPSITIDDVDKMFSFKTLTEFIDMFLIIQGVFSKVDDFYALMDDMESYLVRNGIVYTEVFLSPTTFIRNGMDFNEIVKVIVKQIREIKKKSGIEIKLLIDVSRTFGVENAINNVESAVILREQYKEIIGIGLGGDEVKGPSAMFQRPFELAVKEGFNVVAHAGEAVGPESVWDALNVLNVSRIGHGISSMQDEALMKYLSEKDIPLEICLTSNIITRHFVSKIEDHPIKLFFARGVPVVLNTDDPAFFKVDLIDEYWNLYSKLDFDLNSIKKIIENSFRYSFMPEKMKEKLIKSVNVAWDSNFTS